MWDRVWHPFFKERWDCSFCINICTFLSDDLNEIRLWNESYNPFPRFGLFWVSSQCICLFLLSWKCVCSLTYTACSAHAPYCHVACPAVQYFSTLSHKRQEFREKNKLLNIKCVFWFSLQLLSESFLILRRIQRVIKHVTWSSRKVPIIIVRL